MIDALDALRRLLPRRLKERLKKSSRLSYLIAPFYGYIILPKFDSSALIFGEGIKFFVHPDISAIDCLREIFRNNVYEKLKEVKNGDIVIDVGANVGIFTVKAGKEVGDSGLVCSIEPSPQNVELLKKNITHHNLSSRVIVVLKALSNFQGKSSFSITPVSGQHRFSWIRGLEEERVVNEIETDVDTLDNICKELNLKRIDLLKIDVEGAELDVLKGAEESLKFTKNIAMELHYEGKEIKRFLEERGFEVIIEGNMLYARKIEQ